MAQVAMAKEAVTAVATGATVVDSVVVVVAMDMS